jgi:hypothetical protein
MNKPQKQVLQYIRLEMKCKDKPSSLLGPIVSYEENGVVNKLYSPKKFYGRN